jgi:hypothetical protein
MLWEAAAQTFDGRDHGRHGKRVALIAWCAAVVPQYTGLLFQCAKPKREETS